MHIISQLLAPKGMIVQINLDVRIHQGFQIRISFKLGAYKMSVEQDVA